MFLYDYDAMRAPARRTSHQLIIHADQLLCHNPLHIVCKKKDQIVCQELPGIAEGNRQRNRMGCWSSWCMASIRAVLLAVTQLSHYIVFRYYCARLWER